MIHCRGDRYEKPLLKGISARRRRARKPPLVSRSRSSRCREPAIEEIMSTIPQTYESSLERICRDTIRSNAAIVDRDGALPQLSIDALKSAGLLGGMTAPEVGGLGLGSPRATAVVRRVAEECGSTAMVLCMHYCGAAVLEAHASDDVRSAAAAGSHLSTLAFSEAGSRSHF